MRYVHALVERLRRDNVPVIADLSLDAAENVPGWDPLNFAGVKADVAPETGASHYVLIVCSKRSRELIGKRGSLVEFDSASSDNEPVAGSHTYTIVPVLLRSEDEQHIPEQLRAYRVWDVSHDLGYASLLRFLHQETRAEHSSAAASAMYKGDGDIDLTLTTADGNRVQISAPRSLRVDELIGDLMESLGPASTGGEQGRTDWLVLDGKTKKHLLMSRTLEENGLKSGDAIVLVERVAACPVPSPSEPGEGRFGGWLRRLLNRGGRSGTGGRSNGAPTSIEIDQVHFTVTAPDTIAPGDSAEVHLWAHLESQRRDMMQRARAALGVRLAKRMLAKSHGPLSIPVGSVLEICLEIQGVDVASVVKSLVWAGEIGTVTFVVSVPAEAKLGAHLGRASIRTDGAEVARMEFVLNVGSRTNKPKLLSARVEKHKLAFASYANEDRNEVIGRVQGIQKVAPHLEIFLDVISLRSGQLWEEELIRRIPASDIFYLFWSNSASTSHWVDREWRCALETKGIDFIDPVPLEPPDQAPPPPELASKHFNDPLLSYLRAKPSSN